MEKYLSKWLTMLIMALFCVGFTACSSDDDEEGSGEIPELAEPAYAVVSGKYEITSGDSEIKTLELTESGNYIITLNDVYYDISRAVPAKKPLQFGFVGMANTVSRAVNYGDIIYGKFTKTGDNEFNLEGYGTIVVTDSSIEVEKTNGETFVVTAAKKTQYADSELTNAICRTWSFGTFRYEIFVSGKLIFDGEYTFNQLDKLVDDLNEVMAKYAGDDDEWEGLTKEDIEMEIKPEQIVFSKSGSYMVCYEGDILAIATWAWENESEGLLRYSWNYEDMYDAPVAGNVSVGFRGEQLMVKEMFNNEEDYEYDDEPVVGVQLTYYMNEVK